MKSCARDFLWCRGEFRFRVLLLLLLPLQRAVAPLVTRVKKGKHGNTNNVTKCHPRAFDLSPLASAAFESPPWLPSSFFEHLSQPEARLVGKLGTRIKIEIKIRTKIKNTILKVKTPSKTEI